METVKRSLLPNTVSSSLFHAVKLKQGLWKRRRPPRKPVIKTTEEPDTGRVAARCGGMDESGPAASEVMTRRLPSGKDGSRALTLEVTKKTRNSNNQQSAIESHLSVSDSCRELYRDDVLSVLARGRSPLHLCVLEALYIRKLSPKLCAQNENVLSLQLFGANPRESVRNVSSH